MYRFRSRCHAFLSLCLGFFWQRIWQHYFIRSMVCSTTTFLWNLLYFMSNLETVVPFFPLFRFLVPAYLATVLHSRYGMFNQSVFTRFIVFVSFGLEAVVPIPLSLCPDFLPLCPAFLVSLSRFFWQQAWQHYFIRTMGYSTTVF